MGMYWEHDTTEDLRQIIDEAEALRLSPKLEMLTPEWEAECAKEQDIFTRRDAAVHKLYGIRPGDIVRVTSGRHAGLVKPVLSLSYEISPWRIKVDHVTLMDRFEPAVHIYDVDQPGLFEIVKPAQPPEPAFAAGKAYVPANLSDVERRFLEFADGRLAPSPQWWDEEMKAAVAALIGHDYLAAVTEADGGITYWITTSGHRALAEGGRKDG